MFRLVAEPEAWWPVALALPADGGGVEEVRFEMRFRRLSVSDFEALLAAQADAGDGRSAFERDRAFVARVATDWRGVADADGRPLPFDLRSLERAVDTPGFAVAVGRAYGAFWQAQPAEAEKNSAPSPAGGPATGDATIAAAPSSPPRRAPSSPTRRRRS